MLSARFHDYDGVLSWSAAASWRLRSGVETSTTPSWRKQAKQACALQRVPGELLLEVKNLQTHFSLDQGVIKAVDGVDLRVAQGETLALVGESGCGKTVTALSILRLIDEPGRIAGGSITFKGQDLLRLTESEMLRIRGKEIAMVFQEPMSSLNPVLTVGDQVAEAVQVHLKKSKKEALRLATAVLRAVGIPDPDRRIADYPHQLSGGACQRLMIAMALSCNPSLLIADEPTSSLDGITQAQILDVLARLKAEFNLSLLLITHNLGLVAQFADRVAVMYTGKIVEDAPVNAIFKDPKHPYTVGLLNSIPRISHGNPRVRRVKFRSIDGNVPDLLALPPGCTFAPRCPDRMAKCPMSFPEPTPLDARHIVRCFKFDPQAVPD